MISSRGIEASLLRGKGITSYPLGMSVSEQGEYNFTGQYTSLPAILQAQSATYTRNSVKHVLQNGALVQLAANQFGTSYDPVTGLYGYLPETAATNLALYSEGAAANWSVSNVVDGTTFFGADNALAFGDNSVQRSATKSVTLTSGTSYSVSIYLIMDDGLAPVVGTSTITGDFCLNSQATDHAVAALVQDCGNGVYRVSSARAATATGATTAGIYKYTGQSARGFRITRIQVETGTYASSYIKTAGATATRAADELTVPLANVAGFNAAGYTMFVDCRMTSVLASGGFALNLDDGSYNNRSFIFRNVSNAIDTRVISGGVTQTSVAAGTFADSRQKIAYSNTVNLFLRSVNSSTGTSDLLGSMPISPSTFRIGCNESGNQFKEYIYSAKLITTPLTQSQLNAVTT